VGGHLLLLVLPLNPLLRLEEARRLDAEPLRGSYWRMIPLPQTTAAVMLAIATQRSAVFVLSVASISGSSQVATTPVPATSEASTLATATTSRTTLDFMARSA
jgi:hypothetical protein